VCWTKLNNTFPLNHIIKIVLFVHNDEAWTKTWGDKVKTKKSWKFTNKIIISKDKFIHSNIGRTAYTTNQNKEIYFTA